MSHSVTFGFSLTSLALSDDGKTVVHPFFLPNEAGKSSSAKRKTSRFSQVQLYERNYTDYGYLICAGMPMSKRDATEIRD